MKKRLIPIPLVILFGSMPLLLSACLDDNQNIVQGYIEGELTYVSSSQSGELEQLFVHRGQMIKTKQKLFQLESNPQSSELSKAQNSLAKEQALLTDMELGERPEEITELKAQIEGTDAAIAYYQAQMRRYKDLSKLDYATESAYDEAVFEFKNSSSKLEDLNAQLKLAQQGQREYQIKAQQKLVDYAQSDVERAQWSLDQKNMSAKVNGLVFDTYYWPGEWVAAGQPVLSIQAPENIRVIFFVSETQLGKIQVGDNIEFQCDSCKNPTMAKISYISNEAEYNPPVIYSEEMREKLVYEVKAIINKNHALSYHPGQPVDVALNGHFS